MPEIDQTLRALTLVALLLYLVPAAFGVSAQGRLWLRRGAILALGIAAAIAVAATLVWFGLGQQL